MTVTDFESAQEPVNKVRFATILLGACMCFTGAAGLVNEYILSTVATYILGSSIEQFSVTIALMMASMGAAGWLQNFVSDDYLVEKFVGIEVTLALVGGWAPLLAYGSFSYIPEHFVLVHYTFAISIGALIGLEIPLVLRINEAYSKTLRANIAGVLAWDYIGAFLGAFIWTYWLLRTFPLTEISFYVAGSNFIVAAAAFAYFWHCGLVRRPLLCLIGGALVVFSTVLGMGFNGAINTHLEQRLYDDPIVNSATTRYQRLVVTHNPKTDDTRLYINGNLQLSSADEDRYHELLVHPAMMFSANHETVLVLGGGDGLALRRVLQYPDVRSATLVDLDPDMVKLARDMPELSRLNGNVFSDARITDLSAGSVTADGWRDIWMEENETRKDGRPLTTKVATVRAFNIDADRFVGALGGDIRWDTVIVDFPDPNAIELSKLYSKEFYIKLQRAMAPGAVAVVQSTSPYHAKEAYLMIKRTMEAAGLRTLPFHVNVPSFGDWGFIMAWNDSRSVEEMKDKFRNVKELPVETSYLTRDNLAASIAFGAKDLLTERSDISTLMDPRLLDVYVRQSWQID